MIWECLVWDLDGTLVLPGSTQPVPGVVDVLTARRAAGTVMAVATSAPTGPARALIAQLGWQGLFGHVAGSAPGVVSKTDVVVEALLGLGRALPDGARATALVGDSAADLAAAREVGLVGLGAAWTGASTAALWSAGATLVLTDPSQVPGGPA